MTTRLVVADVERSNKTICLAVSPALKALGVRNRCRVFEIPEGIDYIMAVPRMARYIERSADIYEVYLKYFSPDDIHVYSIDEAFIDITPYLDFYGMGPRELGERVRTDVLLTTQIPASCGLGTNLYLAKVALDISAKHSDDFFGELTEESYRKTLWNHQPLTDFWRIGEGISEHLARLGIHNMGELALAPQDLIYKEFGVDAEIMIDHAWGIEPVRMEHIKGYRAKTHSLSSGQVLMRDYTYDEALTVIKEMVDELVLQLVDTKLLASNVSVWVGHAMTSDQRARARENGGRSAWYKEISSSGGTRRFVAPTNSREEIRARALEIYQEQVISDIPIRRMNVTLGNVQSSESGVQLVLADDVQEHKSHEELIREQTISAVKLKFGKNALLKGIDLLDHATQAERNKQIGGHKSGE